MSRAKSVSLQTAFPARYRASLGLGRLAVVLAGLASVSCSGSDAQQNGSPTSDVPLDGSLDPIAETGTGLIANGDFSSGMDHWAVLTENGSSARGSGVVTSELLHVDVETPSDNDWDLRVHYVSGFPLHQGARYGLFFDAWSDVENKVLRPDINGEGSGEFAHYSFWQPTMLGLESRPWFRVFSMQGGSDSRAWLDFFAANGSGDVFLDNVQLMELASAAVSLDGQWVIDVTPDPEQSTDQLSLTLSTDADGMVDGQASSGWTGLSGVIAGHTLLGHLGLRSADIVSEQIWLRGEISPTGDSITGSWLQYADGATGTFVGHPGEAGAADPPVANQYYCSCICNCDSCVVTGEGVYLESSCEAICPDTCLGGGDLCGMWMGTATGSCTPSN